MANSAPKPDSTCALSVTSSSHSEATKRGIASACKRGVRWGKHGLKLAQENRIKANTFAAGLKGEFLRLGHNGSYYKPDGTPKYAAIARKLNALNVPTPNDGKWYSASVKRVIRRLGPTFTDEILQTRTDKQDGAAAEHKKLLKELLK